jgi:hypothetical protein
VFENDHDIVQGFPSDFETNISRDVVDLNDLFQEKQILEEHQNTIIAFPFSQNFLPCWNGSSSQLFQGIASRSFRKTTPRSPLDMKTKKKHSSVLTDYRYKFKPEKIISNCIHQKQMLLDTIALLTKDLWSATKDAWKTNHPTSSKEKKTKQKNPR